MHAVHMQCRTPACERLYYIHCIRMHAGSYYCTLATMHGNWLLYCLAPYGRLAAMEKWPYYTGQCMHGILCCLITQYYLGTCVRIYMVPTIGTWYQLYIDSLFVDLHWEV